MWTRAALTSRRRDFARLEPAAQATGSPSMHAGRLYVTSQPGVQVFTPAGDYLGPDSRRRAMRSAWRSRGPRKRTLYIVGSGAALGPNGTEFMTPEGVRNNAKSIYRIEMLAEGFRGRAK